MSAPAPVSARALKSLLRGLADVRADVEVCDITLDSRSVTPGSAFFACRGRRHHGLEFASAAIAAGARAIVWEPAPGISAPSAAAAVVMQAVPNLSAQLSLIADRFFDAPSAQLTIAGITGTNGKTTCAYLLAQALGFCGRRTAYLGTIGVGLPGALTALSHTTPDALTLQRLLAQLRDQAVESLALEVSSHALEQGRCAAVRFHTAVFTNLTRDHLDYHGDMQAYGAAKAKLFAWPALAVRVINVDDAFGQQLARELPRAAPGHAPARLFLTSQRPSEWLASGADYVCASAVHASATGLALEIQSSRGAAQLQSALIGDFNVDNLLTVLAVLLAWEVPLDQACAALARCAAAPGRMQRCGGGAQPLVLIDYAHTSDALAKALQAARAHCYGRLWCVFGCGGDRDRGKRGEMGRLAAQLADELIVTDDNPRDEDPDQIVAAILAGIATANVPVKARVIHERAEAIRTALAGALAGDVVLVAGKGHEEYQIIGQTRRPFSDLAVVESLLAAGRSP